MTKASRAKMQIGLAGFGRMGAAMAARIGEQGHDLSVWNRSAAPLDKAKALGAEIVARPADLVARCDVVLTSLFDETAVRAVYFGDGGLARAPLNGRLIIDTSTLPPAMGSELANSVEAAGGRFVDSPVLGTIQPARAGKLIALLGGKPVDMASARPVLELVARSIAALGPSGAGYAGKLAINVMKATYWAAMGDCMGLAQRFGIEPGTILDVIEQGPGASVDLPIKLPVLRGAKTDPAFDIAGCLKDMRLIVEAGGGASEMPVAAGTLAAMARAADAGWGNRDVATVALFGAARIDTEMQAPLDAETSAD